MQRAEQNAGPGSNPHLQHHHQLLQADGIHAVCQLSVPMPGPMQSQHHAASQVGVGVPTQRQSAGVAAPSFKVICLPEACRHQGSSRAPMLAARAHLLSGKLVRALPPLQRRAATSCASAAWSSCS